MRHSFLFWLANGVLCASAAAIGGFLFYWQELFMVYCATTLFLVALILLVMDKQDEMLDRWRDGVQKRRHNRGIS